MTDTTAAMITGKRTLEYRTFASGPPPAGCVTVDLTLCGICGTDVASYRTGHLHSPAVCGHEWVGRISAVGSGVHPAAASDALAPGDRVIIGVPPACGRCPECRRGLSEYCRTVSMVARGRDPLAPAHGGFAPRITVAAGRVVRAHPGLSDEEAAQVEPASVAFHGVRRSRIAAGDVVAVQGAGPIGLFAAQFAQAAGAGSVIVIEPDERRRALASALGATHAVDPGGADDLIARCTDGVYADAVLECTGMAPLLQAAMQVTRSGGTVGLLSFLSRPPSLDAASWLGGQQTVIASNAFTHDDLRRSMGMLADGRVKALPLHSRTVALAELEDALDDLAGGGSADVKVLVDTQAGR